MGMSSICQSSEIKRFLNPVKEIKVELALVLHCLLLVCCCHRCVLSKRQVSSNCCRNTSSHTSFSCVYLKKDIVNIHHVIMTFVKRIRTIFLLKCQPQPAVSSKVPTSTSTKVCGRPGCWSHASMDRPLRSNTA